MQKHFYLMLALTFVTGIASGVFVYTVSRNPEPYVTPEEPATGFEIIAYSYGGCERAGCSSFRLLEDGVYTYLTRTIARGDERFEDSISERQLGILTDLVESTSFKTVEQTSFAGVCPSTYDGIVYRFEIRDKELRYSFDSCTEVLEGEPLFVELIKYFAIMETTYRS